MIEITSQLLLLRAAPKYKHTDTACERCEDTNRQTTPSRQLTGSPTTGDRPKTSVRTAIGSYRGPDERAGGRASTRGAGFRRRWR